MTDLLLIAQTAAPPIDLGNMENYFNYSEMQFKAVSHVLTLGYAVFVAAFVYFIATMRDVAPKFRLSHILSCVVMVSAALILLRQSIACDQTFAFSAAEADYVRKDTSTFCNGFRYMNWSIDVPVLLLQMLVILPIAAQKKISYGVQFVVAGLAMIWTSWAAQFYETGGIVEGVPQTPFWIWYALGWVFYLWILVVVFRTISAGKKAVDERPTRWLNAILALLVVSWTAYAVAIVLPQIWWGSGSGVARQFIFTFADITSKAVYGVMLGRVATILSREEGFRSYPAERVYANRLADLEPVNAR